MGAQDEGAGGFVYPPHLLATAAAALRHDRWRVAGLDAVALGLDAEDVLARLPQVDLLILPVSFATLAADRAFLNELREHKPLLKVLAIGPALSYLQVAHALNDLADLLLSGEPELALPAAAQRLLAGELRPGQVLNPYTLAQAAYQPSGVLADLDAAPLPAWDVFMTGETRYPFLTILSSRGCPAGCAFCPYVAAQGKEHRSQSPARTADELAYLAERFRPAHVVFRDPVFAHDRSRVLALCAQLRHRGLKQSWECESRPEHFDNRLLRAMHAAGCTTVKMGVESADPELLVALGRVRDEPAAKVYLQRAAEVIGVCRELGLVCRVFVMVGLPGQTRAALETTAAWLRQVRPARLHVKPFHWYPGIGLPQIDAPDVAEQTRIVQASLKLDTSLRRRLLGRLTRRKD